jgi:GNAT superfamily N-acetyltransferase
MTATIRDARPEDIPRLLALYWQLSEQSEYPEDAARAPDAEHLEALAQIDADPRVRLVVAENEGVIVGTLALYIMPNLSHSGRPFAIVENVVTDRDVRGGGFGRLLMEYADQIAARAGCYKVSLTSNRKRPDAHAFYHHIGYHATHVGFTRYVEFKAAAG